MLDRNVQDVLLFIGSDQRRLPGGEIYVRANFQNRLPNDDVWAEVKLQFLDANNFPVDETEWVKYRFPALEITTVQGSSISSKAVKHVMLLRNLYTKTGRRIKPGTIFKILGF